jgi:hypothetical protein
MKQKMYPLLLLIAALALIMIGCDAPQEELPEIPEVTEYPSVNPVNNLSMFEQTSEGAMERTGDRLDMGEEIVFLDEVIEVDNIPYAKVRTEDFGEGYVFGYYIFAEGVLGVIIDEGAIEYSEPELDKATSRIVPERLLVAVHPEEDNGFYQIAGYDAVNGSRHGPTWVKKEFVSLREPDWFTSILLYKALVINADNATVKEELLKTARDEFPSSVFNDVVLEALQEFEPTVSSAADNASQAADVDVATTPIPTSVFLVNPDASQNLNVRSTPSISGDLVGQLAPGEEITIDMRTEALDTIGDIEEYWYRVSSPLEGWVFGAFIQAP